MNLSKKMIARTIKYFLIIYVVFIILTLLLLFIFAETKLVDTAFIEENIRNNYSDDFALEIEKDESGRYILSKWLNKSAEMSGGVLQLIDKNGKAIDESRSSDRLKEKYERADFKALQDDHDAYMWKLENGQSVLFIEETVSDMVLDRLKKTRDFPDVVNEKILNEYGAALEIYDNEGERIYGLHNESMKALTTEEVMISQNHSQENKEDISTVHLNNGDMMIVRSPNPHYQSYHDYMFTIFKGLGVMMFVIHILLVLFMIIFSFTTSKTFGKPIIYFLKWIESLSKNNFMIPEDNRLRKKSKLKRKYKIYEEIDQSLGLLTDKLKSDEIALAQIDEKRKMWITGLSHDLKTPLSTIYGYANMLASGHEWTDQEVKKFSTLIIRKAEFMDALINDLTYTYELSENAVVLHKEKVELHQFMVDYLKTYEHEKIDLEAGSEAMLISIDPIKLKRVLDNLISNAIKHTAMGTNVSVLIEEMEQTVLIHLCNQGDQIPEEIIDEIFTRYYRGQNTDEEVAGSGLGLAISKQLIEAHEGNITVSSNDEQTIFTINLPKYKNSKEDQP